MSTHQDAQSDRFERVSCMYAQAYAHDLLTRKDVVYLSEQFMNN
jgi:hypothetical protein